MAYEKAARRRVCIKPRRIENYRMAKKPSRHDICERQRQHHRANNRKLSKQHRVIVSVAKA